MSFEFTVKEFLLGNGGTPKLQFYRRGFNLQGSSSTPSWQDIILSGTTALTLANSIANGLNYLKLFGDTELLPEIYLDTVTLSGGCEQNGTPTPDTPIDIVCNNGALKVKNLFDKSIFASYTGASVAYLHYAVPNGIYTMSSPDFPFTANLANVFFLAGNVNSGASSATNGVAINKPVTITVTDGHYTVVHRYQSGEGSGNNPNHPIDYNWQIEQGNQATTYVPYGTTYTDGTVETVTDSLGNTATAQMLLKVGNNKDTQEVLSGAVTRNIGIKVLDGTENWTSHASLRGWFQLPDVDVYSNVAPALCTHFQYSETVSAVGVYFSTGRSDMPTSRFVICDSTNFPNTGMVTEFKAWLAEQYANGTPVIIVYFKSSTASEAVTGQLLQKSPVTQTAGSISGLPIAITESSKSTPTPQQPLNINCNNGVVKVSKNLFDNTSPVLNLAAGAEVLVANNERFGRYVKVEPNTNYTISRTSNAYFNICGTSVVPNAGASFAYWAMGQAATYSLTTSSSTQYIYIYAANEEAITEGNIQLEKGSTATPYTPYSPNSIYTDGTTETVEITGKNLFDKNYDAQYISAYVDSNTGVLTSLSAGHCFCVPCKSNTTYTLSGMTGNSTWGSFTSNSTGTAATVKTSGNNSITTGANDKYLIGIAYTTASTPVDYRDTLQIEQGSTATEYEPYFNGGTATAEKLLKVGTYQDVQSVIDGNVTRNVGVKVLDGSESWTASATTGKFFISTAVSDWNALSRNGTGYCTHAVFNESSSSANGKVNFDLNSFCFYYSTSSTTLAQFKQFLADQYANGTPVIVVYPTSSPTTETVTAQPMTIQAGTNIAQITQASMDGLELEVKYKAGVEVTITEIENAQLDNNVEVTING